MIFKVRGQKTGYVSGKEKRHKVENFLVNAGEERDVNDLLGGPGYGKVYFKLEEEIKQSASMPAPVIEQSPVPGILGEETCDQVKILSDMYPGSIELIRENIAEIYASKTRMLDIDNTSKSNQVEPNASQGDVKHNASSSSGQSASGQDSDNIQSITDEEINKLTEDELKTKLTTMGVRFFPGAKLDTLRGQFRSALEKQKNAGDVKA